MAHKKAGGLKAARSSHQNLYPLVAGVTDRALLRDHL
jgi:hypothetical protein